MAIRRTAEMKFARDFSKEAFSEHAAEVNPGEFAVVRLPAANDPMLERVRKVREREYLFIDTIDEYYANFHRQMYPSYQSWRASTYDEAIAYNELNAQARGRNIGGALAIIGGIASIYGSDNAYVDAGGLVSITSGVGLITTAISKRNEAAKQAERMREVGSAAEAELVPSTIELENETYRLQGTVDEQYTELRRILRRIYYEDLGLPEPEAEIEADVDTDSIEPNPATQVETQQAT